MSNPPIIRRLFLSTANRHMLTLAMSLTVVFSMPAIVSAQGPPVVESTTTRVDLALKDLEEGLGSSQRQNLFQVQKLLVEGKLEQAEPLVDKALEFFEKETTDTRVDYVSVANRAQLERYQKEHPGSRKLVWLDWCYGWALLKKGWIASSRKRLKEAENWLNKAVVVRPYAAESFIELGYVYTQSRRFDEGLKSYESAIELARTVPMEKVFEAAALRGLGSTLIELKNLPRARKAFRDSLRIEPMNRIAHGELMYIAGLEQKWTEQEIGDLRRQGRWADVMAKLDRRIDAAPDDTMARVLRANARAEQGQWAKAIDEFEAAIKLDQGFNPEALYFIALAHLASGQDEEYRHTCARMLLKVPIEFDAAPSVVGACWVAPEAVNDLTVVAATAAMLHSARVATNARLKKGRPLAETQSDLGRTLYRVGKFDEAVQQLEEAVKMQARGDFSTFFDLAFLAMAQARSGHPEEANRQLAEAKKVLEKVAAPDAMPAPWHVRVAVDRVRNEAETLVQPAEAASKPTTP